MKIGKLPARGWSASGGKIGNSELNPQQQKALESSGPVLVMAGPGTGKTRTLTAKIVDLLENQRIPERKILALTFTKKAAVEIRERVLALRGLDKDDSHAAHSPFWGTFHALGFQILVDFWGQPPALVSEPKRLEIIKQAQGRADLAKKFRLLKTRDLSLLISKAKNDVFWLEADPANELFALVERYDELLLENQVLDFDDLVLKSCRLLRENPDFRDAWKNRFGNILIDEFQDTSPVQYELVKQLISSSSPELFVIGDPFQAIYSFRGAGRENFEKFRRDFPTLKQINLEINYRSAPEIIQVSDRLFPQKEALRPREESTAGKITLVQTFNEFSEADWIIKKINQKVGGLGFDQVDGRENQSAKFSDFAVIFRTHHLARVLKERFRESTLPFQAPGDSLYEQPEIRFLILVLRLVLEENNSAELVEELESASFLRKLGISKSKALEKITAWKNSPKFDRAKAKPPAELLEKIIQLFEVEAALGEKPEKVFGLNQLGQNLLDFPPGSAGLKAFLLHLDDLEKKDFFDDQADRVALLTIHAAKGLEFDYVFIIGLEKGSLPFEKSSRDSLASDSDSELDFLVEDENAKEEEEKRLFYVALSRAKKELFLTRAKKRNKAKTETSPFEICLAPDSPDSKIEKIQDEAIAKIEKRKAQKKRDEEQLRLF